MEYVVTQYPLPDIRVEVVLYYRGEQTMQVFPYFFRLVGTAAITQRPEALLFLSLPQQADRREIFADADGKPGH
jgi:hypothetical protein